MPIYGQNTSDKKGMISYMHNAGAEYTEKDVVKCVSILTTFVEQMEQTKSRERGDAACKIDSLRIKQTQ